MDSWEIIHYEISVRLAYRHRRYRDISVRLAYRQRRYREDRKTTKQRKAVCLSSCLRVFVVDLFISELMHHDG